MITYLVCLVVGLIGAFIALWRPHSEHEVVFGAALYFVALFAAAIHSMHGVAP